MLKQALKSAVGSAVAAAALWPSIVLAEPKAQPSPVFLGIRLGAPLESPQCPKDPRTGEYNLYRLPTTCWVRDDKQPATMASVHLADEIADRFDYLRSGIDVDLFDGRVDGITVYTSGAEGQSAALEALEAKFGKPTSLHQSVVQNGFGATFAAYEAVWRTPSIVVRFHGVEDKLDFGRITVGTPSWDAVNSVSAPKPRL